MSQSKSAEMTLVFTFAYTPEDEQYDEDFGLRLESVEPRGTNAPDGCCYCQARFKETTTTRKLCDACSVEEAFRMYGIDDVVDALPFKPKAEAHGELTIKGFMTWTGYGYYDSDEEWQMTAMSFEPKRPAEL